MPVCLCMYQALEPGVWVLLCRMARIFEISLSGDGSAGGHSKQKHGMSSGQRGKSRVIYCAGAETES